MVSDYSKGSSPPDFSMIESTGFGVGSAICILVSASVRGLVWLLSALRIAEVEGTERLFLLEIRASMSPAMTQAKVAISPAEKSENECASWKTSSMSTMKTRLTAAVRVAAIRPRGLSF